MTDAQNIWKAILNELELTVTRANFATWLKCTHLIEVLDTTLVIGAPNIFTKDWVEKKFHEQILKAAQKLTKNYIKKIEYRMVSPAATKNLVAPNISVEHFIAQKQASQQASQQQTNSDLNARYTFENFVRGKNNELAHAAAFGVATAPGKRYNPLFLYGGVGLGKTHLMHAIGHGILAKNPKAKVVYVTSEKFTNDFVRSVSRGTMEQFKQHYRTADALLVDDVQFLAGKESTAEEFFHTFNELHQNDRQLVLTSDKLPKMIANLEGRLITRMEWGMIADISSPDLETRLAILQMKCREKNFLVEDSVLRFMAEAISENIRELEGFLNRLTAYHEIRGTAPTLDSAKTLLASIYPQQQTSGLTPKRVLAVVSEHFDVSLSDILGQSRKKELVMPRQIAMFLLRETIKYSYPSIGLALGGRDHTTAMHACNKVQSEISRDENVKQNIQSIKQKLYSQSVNVL